MKNNKTSKRLTENLKTFLIVLLIINGALLASKTGLFNDFFKSLPILSGLFDSGNKDISQPGTDATPYQQAALPLAAAVKGSSGMRYGIKYDSLKIGEIYDKFRTELGEALGSAKLPEAADDDEWRAAISGQSIYFEYGSDIPLEVLSRWLGTKIISGFEGSAHRIILTSDGWGGALLYYMDADGAVWRCETRANWSGIEEGLETFLPNGAQFAYEKAALTDTEPYELILGELPALYKLTAIGSPLNNAVSEKASDVFGVAMHSDSSYTESGTVVYLDNSGTMKLTADGYISYDASGGNGLASAEDTAGMVEASIEILGIIHGVFSGVERLYFTGYQKEGETCRLTFDYFVEGAEVIFGSDNAAEVTFVNGSLTQLKLKIRSYSMTEEKAELWPEYQAAASAGSKIKGAEAKLVWPDGGGEAVTLSPIWIAE